LQNEARKLYRRLAHLRSERAKKRSRHDGYFSLSQDEVDLEKKLGDLQENLRAEQSDVSLASQVYDPVTVCSVVWL